MGKFTLDSVVKNSLSKPPIIVVHGNAGVGKTTFASQAPNCIFITAEDGLGLLEVNSFPQPETASDVNEQMQLLMGEHNYEWLVVDSITALEKKIWSDLCDKENVESIEDIGGGWGKGYTRSLEWVDQFLRDLQKLRDIRGMGIILIAHTRIQTISPPDKPAYDQYMLNLNKKIAEYIHTQADIVAFAEVEIMVKQEEKGFGAVQGSAIETGKRLLHCYSSTKYTSKNRYGIQQPLEMKFDVLMNEIFNNAKLAN